MPAPTCLRLVGAALLPAALLLQSCDPGGRANAIQSIGLDTFNTIETASGHVRGLPISPKLDEPIKFVISGTGTCNAIINWGDGTPNQRPTLYMAGGADTIPHTFTSWRGGKPCQSWPTPLGSVLAVTRCGSPSTLRS